MVGFGATKTGAGGAVFAFAVGAVGANRPAKMVASAAAISSGVLPLIAVINAPIPVAIKAELLEPRIPPVPLLGADGCCCCLC